MCGADIAMAQILLERAKEPNVVQALVEVDRLDTRNTQRWVNLDAAELRDFPELTIENLQDITIGTYRIKLSPSYVQDKLQKDANEEYHVKMLRDQNRLLQPGFMRVRIFSHFRNATRYQLSIAYRPTNENENDQDEVNSPINGYYCTCKSGARTLGTCAHIASVVWYLGYALHQENIRYPPVTLIQSINDAANRPHA